MRIVYTNSEGMVCVVHAAPRESIEQDFRRALDDPEYQLSDATYRTHVLSRSIPLDASNIVETDDIPTDRTFRNAWKQDGRKIIHDMDKCREIHRDRLRAARAPMLAALDVEYQRADEASDGQKKKDVAARKQALRDVTSHPDIDAAQTVDDLKAVWPL